MDFDYCPNTSIKDSVSAFIDWYKTYDKGEFSVSNCSGQWVYIQFKFLSLEISTNQSVEKFAYERS